MAQPTGKQTTSNQAATHIDAGSSGGEGSHLSSTPKNCHNVVVVTGGNGFIGSHVAKRLHDQGEYVRVLDNSDDPTFRFYKDVQDFCSEFLKGDLRDPDFVQQAMKGANHVYHFAANMGGMGIIHPSNDLIIYQDNHIMTLNILQAAAVENVSRLFYASSACVYPDHKQSNYTNEELHLKETDAWSSPPQPQHLYGTEKLCSELLVSQYCNDRMHVRIARFHNVYGEGSTWVGGREKAPAALLRKAICAVLYEHRATVELWGSGKQRRSFLYIDDCVDAVTRLMESDYNQPLNIGSDQAVSMTEMAHIAFETVGISSDRVDIVQKAGKPVGVQNRNSDNSLVMEKLGWSPKVSIREGMQHTSEWIQKEVNKQFSSANDAKRTRLIDEYKQSVVKDLADDHVTYGIILPITSRGLSRPEDCIENIQRFAKSLRDTTKVDRYNIFGKKYRLKVYLGVDEDDVFFHPVENNCAKKVLMKYGITDVETKVFNYPPGSICHIWRDLAQTAYDQGCQYTVLFGDDVVLKTASWMSIIDEAFSKLAAEKGVPYGFGCISFFDQSFPGFPTFPVISRIHFQIFDGKILPPEFVNQDGDPYLFQLYRRWGCSVLLQDVMLMNTVGGPKGPRYKEQHHECWTFDALDTGVAMVKKWLEQNSGIASPPQLLTLDVMVPSYRVNPKYLEPIINLNRSPTCSTTIIIIVDNPASPEGERLMHRHEHDPFIRIRINPKNMGTSATRNKGLGESAADYVLFLDDDVIPDPNIIVECEKVIRQHPLACGFVGNSQFPDPTSSVICSGVIMAGVAFFWDIAERMQNDIPWGVTANLLVRRNRDDIWFNLGFPKTGGGEDVDYCLRKRDFFVANVPGGEGFKAAPLVKIVHPWWDNGSPSLNRFMTWADGDGALIKMYPDLIYKDVAPNSAEMLLYAAILFLLSLLGAVVIGGTTMYRLSILFLAAIPLVLVASILFEIYRHIFRDPTEYIPALQGYRRVLAAIESSFIRLASEWGRLEGLIRRGEWTYIGWRFDWFAGRWGTAPMTAERMISAGRFLAWLGLVACVAGWMFV